MAVIIQITNAGRAALVNASNTGTNPILIAQVGLSASAITPSPSATSLTGEHKRLSTLSGAVVADDTIHLTVRDESSDTFTVRSFGLYLADGTLFAIYGQAPVLVEKSAQSMMLLAIDIKFADITAADLTFGNTNFLLPPATKTAQGIVELATDAETTSGTDDVRAVTPKGVKAAVTNWLDARFGSGAPSPLMKTILAKVLPSEIRSELGLKNAALRDEGAGNGLDADKLDGQEGAWYSNIPARLGFTPLNAALYTAADVIAKLLTVDGAGSGLDADLLDGQEGSYYTNIPARLGYTPVRQGDGINQATTPINLGKQSGANKLRVTVGGVDFGNLLLENDVLSTLVTVDGSGSGVDADLLDGQQGSYYTDITARLGFKPVGQGNGIGQSNTNDVKIGWSGTRLKATVDAIDLGNFVFDNHITTVWRSSNDGSGSGLDADLLDGKHASDFALLSGFESGSNANGYWRKLPDGTIEQWGTFTGAYPEGAAARTFPIPFTDVNSINVQSICLNTGASPSNDMWTQAGTQSLTGFSVVFQATSSGNTAFGARWRAIGR
jgi:hypothetical protein